MKRLQLPETLPTGIEVWQIKFDLDSPQLENDWMLLNDDERSRALRFHQRQDQVRFIVTRAALRRLLAERVMLSPKKLRLEVSCLGKPRLQAHSNIEFSVSHAGSFALIALSTLGEVGVDIERCQRNAANLEAQVLSATEQAWGIWSSRNFIELWVVKESVLKALGLGIAEYLQAITVLPNHDGSYCIAHDQSGWPGIRAWSIGAPPDYKAALALTNQNGLRSQLITSYPHFLQSA